MSAIALAETEETFLRVVFSELENRRLIPDDEYDEIEELSERFRCRDLSDEWIELCHLALDTRQVAFNVFDLYTAE